MRFYVSWSHSDPLYQMYDERCSMLISITAVSQIWNIKRFPQLPYQIMLDSGSYSYVANGLPLPIPKAVFQRQLDILAGCSVPATICAVDMPILDKSLPLAEKNRAIDKTIKNACELKVLMTKYNSFHESSKRNFQQVEPLAIVQGYDIHTIKYCAKNLQELGYTQFGLGSMAHLYDTKEIVKRVEAIQSIVGPFVHIFGVSAVETMKYLNKLKVASVDSARPIKAAIYNEIIYSEPYRRFGIAGSQFQSKGYKFSPQRLLTEVAIKCPCPVCEHSTNNDILKLGVRKHLLQRAIHNYYHVKKMIAGW